MEQRKFRMPTAYTILFCLILLVALSTWLIPAGSYDYADGIPISGSYHAVAPAPQGIGAALKAAFRGFYDAVDVCVFILMVGGFLGVVMKTGAIDAGVSNVISRLQGREKPAHYYFNAVFRSGRHHLRHVGGDHGLLPSAAAYFSGGGL